MMMKKSKHLFALLALGAMVALVGLAGCGKPAKSSTSTARSSKVTHVKKTKTKKATAKTTAAASSSAQKEALWSTAKDQQLKAFIAQWAPTMGQSYTEYDGKNSLRTSTGTTYPDALQGITIRGAATGTIGWAPTGEGQYDYNVVAIYNYDGSQPPLPNHITYVFAFHHGQPIALVDQTRDGSPILSPTQNAAVKANFTQIASASASTTAAAAKTASKQPTMSPQAIGVMLMMLRGDDVESDSNVTFDNNTASYPYLVSSGTAVTQVPFHYDQTTVTYAVRNPNYTDAEQVFDDHTISLAALRAKYYATAAQQQAVEAVVARLKH